jgi:hypothetical protein
VEWLVRPLRAGAPADTPQTLRQKAREFTRLAAEARDPVVVLELRKLADEYEQQAAGLERTEPLARPEFAASLRP